MDFSYVWSYTGILLCLPQWLEQRKKDWWVRIIVEKQVLFWSGNLWHWPEHWCRRLVNWSWIWNVAQKCFHTFSLEKFNPLELCLQWSTLSANHFLTASLLCFLSCFHSERKKERESMSINFFLIAKQIWDSLVYNFRYCHTFSVSWLPLTIWLLLNSSFISYNKDEKMVNKPHEFTCFPKAIWGFSCYCLPLKQDKPKLYCICAPSTAAWKECFEKIQLSISNLHDPVMSGL